MIQIPHRNSRTGQSLLETMVALTILTVGFLGIVTLLSQSYHLQRMTADQVTASYLAAEGLELTRNNLEVGMFTNQGWLDCLRNAPSYYSYSFQIDFTSNIVDSNGDPDRPNCLANANAFYSNSFLTLNLMKFDMTSAFTPFSPLYFSQTNKLYGRQNSFKPSDNAVPTHFYRKVYIYHNLGIANNPEIEITVLVSWGANRTKPDGMVALNDHLYHWFPSP